MDSSLYRKVAADISFSMRRPYIDEEDHHSKCLSDATQYVGTNRLRIRIPS